MSDSSHKLLCCTQIGKAYVTEAGPIPAVTGIEFSLNEGETAALVGPSGCGKSTLLLMFAGLERPTSGAIEFKGQPLTRPHREIALVLQDYGLFPWKTVRENVILGLKIRKEPIDTSRGGRTVIRTGHNAQDRRISAAALRRSEAESGFGKGPGAPSVLAAPG